MEYGNTIQKDNGYNAGYTYYPVVIIGAGESGIAMGCRLNQALGFDQFRIFDRQSGVGGTWWINRYPGVACDIPAAFYSFSFHPNPDWTSFYPSGPEILKYFQGACNHFKIVDKIQLNTDVRECRWLEAEQVWELTLQHLMSGVGDLSEHDRSQRIKQDGQATVYISSEKVRAKVLISAVGGLVEPKTFPENIPGSEKFKGSIFHSARWRYDVDLRDKDIIVLGTGCSAAQFVPRLTTDYGAKSVTQIMRSPPWTVPRPPAPGGDKAWEKWAPWLSSHVPGFNKAIRLMLFLAFEADFSLFGGEPHNEKIRQDTESALLEHMKRTVPEKYHEILTPDYGVGCKRRIFDTAWLPSLNDPKIELTTIPLTRIGDTSVILGPGRLYPPSSNTTSFAPTHELTLPADVIILANGFEATKWFHPLHITGRTGTTLEEVFAERGGPQMYMGTAMDGFPNLFTIFGPNTATGHSSVILASENMVEQSLKFITPILRGDVKEVEVKKSAEMEWARDIQEKLKGMVWSGCGSWYMDDKGWNSALYPYSQINFGLRCLFPTWSHWNITYTRKGRAKRILTQITRAVALFTLVATVFWVRKVSYRQGISSFQLLKRYATALAARA